MGHTLLIPVGWTDAEGMEKSQYRAYVFYWKTGCKIGRDLRIHAIMKAYRSREGDVPIVEGADAE